MIVSCPSCQRNYVVADEQIAGKQFRARCKSCGVEFRLDGTPSREPPSGDEPPEPAKFMSATERYLALQTAPPPSGGTWSVCVSQTDTRRMTAEEVAQALAKGTISTNVFVWKNGMPKWLRLSDVPDLMTASGKSASRIPPAVVAADAATRASRPAPPTRFNSTIISSQPPPPVPGTGISARSGQTVPPPPMVPDIAGTHTGPSDTGVAAGTVRRSTPAPPRRGTLDIPIDVDLSPPAEAAAPPAANDASAPAPAAGDPAASAAPTSASENAAAPAGSGAAPAAVGDSLPSASAVMLPPMKGSEAASASAGSASPVAVSKWPVQKKHPYDSKATSKPPAAEAVPATTESSRPPPESSKSKRFAGAIVAMSVVGIVGVLGGVAGAVYVMKNAMGNMPQASASVVAVALQPQAATPVPGAASVAVAGDVAAGPGAGAVIDGDAVGSQTQVAAKPRSAYAGGRVTAAATRTGSKATELKAAEPKSAGPKAATAALPSLPPAPEPKAKAETAAPAASGAKFNRDAALAVLGMAASRASTCKKPGGPTGTAKVYVTFDPSGSVVIANVVGAPVAGTGVAQCVATLFRKVRVPPFGGDRASLSKDFTIPP